MKRIIALGLLLFSLIIAMAQSESLFKGGGRVGFSTSQISGDDLTGFHKFGGYAGFFANVPINKDRTWKFQIELNFIMKGSSTYRRPNKDGNVVGNIYKLNLYYTETPLLFKYVGWESLELEIGPSINFLFHVTEKENNMSIIGRPKFAFFDINGIIGLSYLYKEHYGVNIRYSNSIIPIRTPTWAVNRLIKKQMNSAITVTLLYQF